MQYELSLYEIGGTEPIDQIDPRQVSDADAIVLVFSLSSPDTSQQLRFYQARLAQIAPEVSLFLVGMMSVAGGLEEELFLAVNIEEMAHNWGIRGFWKTTVQAGLNIQNLIGSITALPRTAGKTALKLVFVGPAGGGKSALISKLANVALNGIYTPTTRSRVVTVKCDVPAIPKSEEEEKDKKLTLAQEKGQEEFAVEKQAAASIRRISPAGVDREAVKSNLVDNEMLRNLVRMKAKMQQTPISPPAGAPASPSAPAPAGGENDAPTKQPAAASVTADLKGKPLVTLSEGPLQPTPEAGIAFAVEEDEKGEATPPTPTPTIDTITSRPSPPLPAPPSEEMDRSVIQDEGPRSEKKKRKDKAKAEKGSRAKPMVVEEKEEETLGIDSVDGGERALNAEEGAPTEMVEKILERRTTVFYRKQMNPLTRNKLSVVLSTLKIYEKLKKLQIEADRVGGGQLQLTEAKPIVQVQPVFPGCICVPAQAPLDARKDSDTADFHITPLATGEVMDACVRIYHEGKLVDTIQTPTKVVNQTSAKVSALAAVVFPIFGPLFDERIGPFLASVIPFWDQIGGIENFFLIIAGALAFFGTIMYYIHRPKQAIPIEANFPELQKFLDEDVNNPDFADVLKEKVEQDKSEQE